MGSKTSLPATVSITIDSTDSNGGGAAKPVALNWPAMTDWHPLYDQSGNLYADSNDDAEGSQNLVGDSSIASAYLYNNGTYQFFRMLLGGDPRSIDGDSFSDYELYWLRLRYIV